MNAKELEFTVFCIESVAEYLELKGDEIYKLVNDVIGYEVIWGVNFIPLETHLFFCYYK